jgi:hypothetical protein
MANNITYCPTVDRYDCASVNFQAAPNIAAAMDNDIITHRRLQETTETETETKTEQI